MKVSKGHCFFFEVKTDRGDQLLDDLVETVCVRGNSRTTADVQGKLAQRENVPSAIPARKKENTDHYTTQSQRLAATMLYQIEKQHILSHGERQSNCLPITLE